MEENKNLFANETVNKKLTDKLYTIFMLLKVCLTAAL